MANDIALIVAFLFIMIVSISNLARRNSLEIFAIWYLFSLFLMIFIALYVLAERSGQDITDLLGPPYAVILKFIYDMLTNLGNELFFVCAVLYIGIGPQFLTYILSGISGSASQTIFVKQIVIFAVWMLIKFMAALSGILFARPFADLLFSKPAPISAFVQALGFTSAAFALAFAHHRYFDGELEVSVAPGVRIYISTDNRSMGHSFFTRNRQKPLTPTEPEKKPESELQLKVAGIVVHLRGPVPLISYYLLRLHCRRRKIYRFLTRHFQLRKISQKKDQGPA